VRIWRDLNQDGISQSDELKTPGRPRVASINMSSSASTVKYTDAQLVRDGSFTRTNGKHRQAAASCSGRTPSSPRTTPSR